MYKPRTGRFNAVDPVFNALFDPQKWNRYSYARNNPTLFIDPMGLDPNRHVNFYGFFEQSYHFYSRATGISNGGGGGGGPRNVNGYVAETLYSQNVEAVFHAASEREKTEEYWRGLTPTVTAWAGPIVILAAVPAAIDAAAKATAATVAILGALGLFELAAQILAEDAQPWRPFPGWDPTRSPGDDWEWKGRGQPGSNEGNWVNPKSGEWLRPDLGHAPPIGPHWDWQDPSGNRWRINPDGKIEPKQ